MKKSTTKWVVRALTEEGWVDYKTFTDFNEADGWLCDFCRKHGFWITDFNIVKR